MTRPSSSAVVFGRVEFVVVSESAIRDGRPAIDLLAPLSRLGAASGRRSAK